ncbi:MAG: restriction endonuclease subunit S, partial [Peptostreptococcaceae bacterium]|nr:restriction endonuclease subunit S [Peptostreptococcaceae bacterium]
MIPYKDLFDESIDFRLDAEYHKKDNLEKNNVLIKKGFSTLGEFAYVTDGIHTSIDYCEKSQIHLFSATTPKENYFDLSRGVYISEKAHSQNPRTALKENDIIISTVGTIGNCAVVNQSVLPANSDRHVGIIRLEDNSFKPRFISTFLLSKYGTFQTLRESTGNVQLNLFLYKIRTLKIPNLSLDFQERIEELVVQSDGCLESAKLRYVRAENLLISELGLENFHPSKEKISIKSLKESFLRTGRLDSEYYQPKYDEILKKIMDYGGGFKLLSECCTIKDKNYMPNDHDEYRYIELSNIGMTAEINDCTVSLGKELPTRARRKVEEGDVIISSVEGSLDRCAIVPKKYHNALCSTGFYVVNSDRLNSETLLTLFKSDVMLALMKKGCSGTILTNISKEEFCKLPIPIIDEQAQIEISEYIKQSMEYKENAKALLENAKKSVEIAIDKDETEAHNF